MTQEDLSPYEQQVSALAGALFPKLDGSAWGPDEPEIWEAFGAELTPQLEELGIQRIITWDQLHSTVLAHVVARNIGAKVTHAFAEDGLLGLERTGENAEKAVLLDVDWPDHPPVSALHSYVESQGYEVVRLVSVLLPKILGEIEASKIITLEQATE